MPASSSILAAASRGSTPQSRAWISRFRRPVSERSTTGSWKTTLLTRRAASGCFATSKPASRALPAVGSIVVVSMPTVVDLPAPFGPSRPKTSPAATSKSMPLTASTPPGYVLLSLVTSIAFTSLPSGSHNCRVSFVREMTDSNAEM